MTRLPAVVVVVSLLGPAAARAQSSVPAPAVELRGYHGTPFSDRTLRLDGTAVLPAFRLHVGLEADYAHRPLLADATLGAGGPQLEAALVRHAIGASLSVALGLFDRAELALQIPAIVRQTGDTVPGLAAPASGGLEALRVGAKVRLLGDGKEGPGLGAAVLAAIPLGGAGGLLREEGIGAEGRLFADWRGRTVTVGLGGGYRLRPATSLYDLPLDDEVFAAAALAVHAGPSTTVLGELAGATAAADPFKNARQSPLEALFGIRQRIGSLSIHGAAGPGLVEGYGTPSFRAVVGLAWINAAPDADEDGIPDGADRCPSAGEDRDGFEDGDGCPELDNDKDGIPDSADRCPVDTEDPDKFEDGDGCPDPDNDKDDVPDATDKCPNEPEARNRFQDDDGCPDEDPGKKDGDGDGVSDADDKCPSDPEDRDEIEDTDGCPDPDNDKDGIADEADKCPNEPETINNVDDGDGCPDKGRVTLKAGELETLRPVFFDTDRARVRHAFHQTLDDIAAILKAHPEIGRCAIEGHTDARGPKEWNQKLSLDRAQAVVRYLVDKGVAQGRLTAIGQGGDLPWASNATEEGRAANRRVIFHIEGVEPEDAKRQIEIQKTRVRQRAGGAE